MHFFLGGDGVGQTSCFEGDLQIVNDRILARGQGDPSQFRKNCSILPSAAPLSFPSFAFPQVKPSWGRVKQRLSGLPSSDQKESQIRIHMRNLKLLQLKNKQGQGFKVGTHEVTSCSSISRRHIAATNCLACTGEFCHSNLLQKIKSDRTCVTCCRNKILQQRQSFSQNFSSTQKAICSCDVSPQHVAATSRLTCTHGMICSVYRPLCLQCFPLNLRLDTQSRVQANLASRGGGGEEVLREFMGGDVPLGPWNP